MQTGLSTKRLRLLAVSIKLALSLLLGMLVVLFLTSILTTAGLQTDQAGVNIAGGLDPSFGVGGIVTTPVGSDDDWIYALALQKDGKIVVLGETRLGAGNYSSVIACYTVTGALDAGFGTGGIVTNSLGTSSDIAIQGDDKIVVVGGGSSHFIVARYTVSGTLDASFGTGGVADPYMGPDHYTAEGVAIQDDGKIVVAGHGGYGGFVVARYTTSGTLDSSFGMGGVVTTSLGSSYDDVSDVAIQGDGKIVVVGDVTDILTYDFAVVRYTISGTLDASFGVGGIVTTSTTLDGEEFADSVAIQEDGGIVVAGGNGDLVLLRYTTTGELDAGFGVSGIVTTSIGTGVNAAFGVAIQKDGKVVAIGGLTMAAIAILLWYVTPLSVRSTVALAQGASPSPISTLKMMLHSTLPFKKMERL